VWLRFNINPRSYKCLSSNLVGGLALDVFFATFFTTLTFLSHFEDIVSHLNDIFFHQCVGMLVLKHFIV